MLANRTRSRKFAHLLAIFLLAPLAHAQEPTTPPDDNVTNFTIEVSGGDDEDTRTRYVRNYFLGLGRSFEVYRIRPDEPTPATVRYQLDRERAGNYRYNALSVSHKALYRYVASSVNNNFDPLQDTVNNDGSSVTGTELLQIIFRQAKSLEKEKADLDALIHGVSVTYVHDDMETIVVPTTFNFKEGSANAEGTELKSHFRINSFSKHYLLAMILNEEAQVSMAGKIHIGVKPLDPETPVDIAHVFNESGDVDLEKFSFDVLVTNDSGTFKPDGKYLPSFAQLLVDDLNIPQLSYKAWTPPGTPKIEGIVYRGGTR